MNVLFLVHYSELYGSIRSLLDLISGLRQYGVVPHFVLPNRGGLSEVLDQKTYKYMVFRAERWVSEFPVSIFRKIKLSDELSRSSDQMGGIIDDWSIELLYTSTIVSPVGLIAATRNHIPHIWHIREFGDLDFGLRFIYPKALCKAFMLRSDAVICHGKVVRSYYFKSGIRNVHQIYNGVALKHQFDERLSRRRQSLQDCPFTFMMMSGITPKKGQEVAIRALAELRDQDVLARLVVGGSGKPEYLDHLTKLCHELDLEDKVTFTGFVEDPFPLYYQSDCVLICSEHEALSRVGLEAMSTALPLIGRNSGGNPEIIVPGETGFLYDSFDELVAGMKIMIQEPDQARKMGFTGWQRARELFNIEDYATNVYRVIQSVVE